jgi:hypothetical protein
MISACVVYRVIVVRHKTTLMRLANYSNIRVFMTRSKR